MRTDEAISPEDMKTAITRIERHLSRILAAVDRDELLTEREAAAIRRKTVYALRKERARGGGPPYVKDGATIRYSRAQLARWIDEHTKRPRSDEREPRFGTGAQSHE